MTRKLPLLLLTVAACSTPTSQAQTIDAPPPVKVVSAKAELRPMPRYVTLTGSLAANRESKVAADGMGTVAQTFIERGTQIVAGAPLVKLDTRAAGLSAAEARAQVDATRAAVDLAKAECARSDKLYAEHAINEAQHDRAKAECTQAQSQAQAAVVRQRMAGKTLGDATVRAPFTGMIVERNVNVGEYVRPGQQVAVLVDVSSLRLELTVPEAMLHSVAVGQKVSFTASALPGESFEGTIRFVSPAVRIGSRDFIVEAEVDNAERRLAAGMFATARVSGAPVPTVVAPVTALRKVERSSPRLFVVVDGKLEERVVQLGPEQNGVVSVLAGLAAGETIVTQVTPALFDGARVL
jgi:membrane fusion protein, multidrug efflux system